MTQSVDLIHMTLDLIGVGLGITIILVGIYLTHWILSRGRANK